jgi:sporulation protein YlmC with PRC-barrel domain
MMRNRLAAMALAAVLAAAPALAAEDDGAATAPAGDEGSIATTVFEATGAIPFDALEGQAAHNLRGEAIGQVTGVVMEEAAGDLFVVVSAGGVLDIGDADIVFPYADVAEIGGEVVIDTALSQDSLEERGDYEADRFVPVPADEVIR